jgi:hypothetical protein
MKSQSVANFQIGQTNDSSRPAAFGCRRFQPAPDWCNRGHGHRSHNSNLAQLRRQSRLVGMQSQSEFREALPNFIQELRRRMSRLKTHHAVVRVANYDYGSPPWLLAPVLNPLIERVVQIDLRQSNQRRIGVIEHNIRQFSRGAPLTHLVDKT